MKKNVKFLPDFLTKKFGVRMAYFYAWGIVVFALSFIVVAITLACLGVTNIILIASILFGVPILVTAVVEIKAFRDGRVIVKQNHAVLVEQFGEYIGDLDKDFEDDKEGVLREGLSFLFHYFKIFEIQNDNGQYFLGRSELKLFQHNELVNFKDASVSIEASVFIKITDLRKAVYGNLNYETAIVGIIESAIKETLEGLNLKELSEKKDEFEIFNIFSTEEEKKENEGLPLNEKKCSALNNIKNTFGISIESIIVPQIKYTEEEKKSAAKINAEKNHQEEVKIANDIKVSEADTAAKILDIKTQAEIKQKKDLAEAEKGIQKFLGSSKGVYLKEACNKAGITIEQLTNLLVVEGIKPTDKLFFAEGIDAFLAKLHLTPGK